MMKRRRLSDGLHRAIEAKEGVNPAENVTLASITFRTTSGFTRSWRA